MHLHFHTTLLKNHFKLGKLSDIYPRKLETLTLEDNGVKFPENLKP